MSYFGRNREAESQRKIAIVRDQLQAEIDRAGIGIKILNIFDKYNGWQIQMLQWQPNGIAAKIIHDFSRNNHRNSAEESIRQETLARFSRYIQKQSEFHAQWGVPEIKPADKIIISQCRIESPLLRALVLALGDDAGIWLRNAMAANNEDLIKNSVESHKKCLEAGIKDFGLSFGRDTVKGSFLLTSSNNELRWVNGSLLVLGLQLPDSVVSACIGRKLQEIVDHPLLHGDMIITAVNKTRKMGKDGYSFVVKNMYEEMPAHW